MVGLIIGLPPLAKGRHDQGRDVRTNDVAPPFSERPRDVRACGDGNVLAAIMNAWTRLRIAGEDPGWVRCALIGNITVSIIAR